MKGKDLHDVPKFKKCCVNCTHSFLNPRKEIADMKQLGKFPLCTCKHPKHRQILQDPREQKCEDFKYKPDLEMQL